jgi:hypothetical protein
MGLWVKLAFCLTISGFGCLFCLSCWLAWLGCVAVWLRAGAECVLYIDLMDPHEDMKPSHVNGVNF